MVTQRGRTSPPVHLHVETEHNSETDPVPIHIQKTVEEIVKLLVRLMKQDGVTNMNATRVSKEFR